MVENFILRFVENDCATITVEIGFCTTRVLIRGEKEFGRRGRVSLPRKTIRIVSKGLRSIDRLDKTSFRVIGRHLQILQIY